MLGSSSMSTHAIAASCHAALCSAPCPALPSISCWPHHPARPAAPHHALDDAPLLVVLLAKEGGIRLHNVEQLGHHLLG